MTRIEVLDHGFVELVETYGSDERIIEAARESTDKGFLGWGPKCVECGGGLLRREDESAAVYECYGCHRIVSSVVPGDEKLLRYLWENKHFTPFEFAGAVIRVQAPIFVFREWHRHRTQSFSEISARYIPLPDLHYVPSVERLMLSANAANKQAGAVKGSETLTVERASIFRELLSQAYAADQSFYEHALSVGIPKELARAPLAVGRYSRMRAQANLRNWLAFLALREAPNAQWEIRQFAEALHVILKQKFPRTLALFEESHEGLTQ